MLAGCGGVADASPKSTFSHWGAGFLGADAGAEAEGEVGADAAVTVWATRYGQRAWLRQLEPAPGRAMEDALLRTIARPDGTPFPSVARLASGWLRGRVPPLRRDERDASLETAYCAEIVAVTYQAMGLLPGGRRPDWYDAGRFWSGDDLRLCGEARLSGEVAVQIPETQLSAAGG